MHAIIDILKHLPNYLDFLIVISRYAIHSIILVSKILRDLFFQDIESLRAVRYKGNYLKSMIFISKNFLYDFEYINESLFFV